ncbi:MAG: hypothetical protein AB1Z65_00770 [Candidatus Sulfomarinibacteraceae bacterium]
MSDIDNTWDSTCPSCGAPRLGHAWDCARCGAVFDTAEPAEVAQGQESTTGGDPPPRPRQSGSGVLRSSTARRPDALGPSRGTGFADDGLAAIRGWVRTNKAVAVILSFVVYVVVVWSFGAMIIGATDSPGAIKKAYRDLTGRPLPDGFGPTFAAHFVSRKLVVLDRPDQVLLVLYRGEDGASGTDVMNLAEGALDVLEIPWERVRTRSATIAGETIEVPVLRLWGEGGPHLYLVPVATVDGGHGMEAVLGPPETVLDVVEEMVSRR